MQLSRYVFETVDASGNRVWHNSVTLKSLPATATEEELRKELFLAGDEEAAVHRRLLTPFDKCAFTLIITWECNLRCTHCTVIDKLKRNDDARIDVLALADYLTRYRAFYDQPSVELFFLGGEPLLYPQLIEEIIATTNLQVGHFGITTNLSLVLTDERLACLKKLQNITVSLDGLETSHNKQRHSLYGSDNLFMTTYENLKTLVKHRLRDRITVQAALSDEFLTDEQKADFFRALLRIGIRKDRISYGCLHPTKAHPTLSGAFRQIWQLARPAKNFCCKYRHNNFVIDSDGTIYSDYYSWIKLGTIADPIKELQDTHKNLIIANMPVLNDPICKQQCPVLGYCWGGCSNADLVIQQQPSKYCNQEALLKNVTELAISGKLL